MSDWRESAYLNKSNWPEAIPNCGPKREYGPYPFNSSYGDELNDYPRYHPDAASIGEFYLGDVCPFCGVPINYRDDTVVTPNRGTGTLEELYPDIDEWPEVAYHKTCHYKRQHRQNTTLDEWAVANE